MKKTSTRVVAAPPETVSGTAGGIDIGALYVDMLCERFKNRGIKSGLSELKSAEIRKNARMLGISVDSVSAEDAKYKSLNVDGQMYMSSDDFAAYYKDLRGYKLPHFYSRAEKEYEDAEADAKNVQDSGKPPKKAVWLAIKRRTKDAFSDFFSIFVVEEIRKQSEEMEEGTKTRVPKKIIPTLCIVTLSLMLIVCSTVMVSRASGEISQLEGEIEVIEYEKNDLEGKLNMKNDMLNIKDIAVDQYGMISGDYAASRYVDIKGEEKIVIYEETEKDESLLTKLLKAIGLLED